MRGSRHILRLTAEPSISSPATERSAVPHWRDWPAPVFRVFSPGVASVLVAPDSGTRFARCLIPRCCQGRICARSRIPGGLSVPTCKRRHRGCPSLRVPEPPPPPPLQKTRPAPGPPGHRGRALVCHRVLAGRGPARSWRARSQRTARHAAVGSLVSRTCSDPPRRITFDVLAVAGRADPPPDAKSLKIGGLEFHPAESDCGNSRRAEISRRSQNVSTDHQHRQTTAALRRPTWSKASGS